MIEFLHPWALAGLAGAAIPVLLHLLARREPPTVEFPAVRYLIATTQEHLHRLKLQNLLLLAARTLLIVAIVLAAAGPTVARSGLPSHAPGALALIVDNSPSSGVVVGGSTRLASLLGAARAVLSRATPNDALWLITADGVPRGGDADGLRSRLGALPVSSYRLDLGSALGVAMGALATDARPGEVVLLSDLQASAVSPADVTVPLIVGRSDDQSVRNAGIGRLETGPQPWSTDGGRITVSLVGDSVRAAPVSARLGERPARQALASGGTAVFPPIMAPAGWWTATAELDPDEFRLDDRRLGAVRVAPVARVDWDSASRYVAAACEVLESNHRIMRGNEVTVGRLARGGSIVMPPADPAEIGALNRALAARGVSWSFGAPVAGGAAATDSGALTGRVRVLRRYALEPSASGRTGVLATVGGAPWLARSGNVLLIGSRLDPEWTDLPVSAGFMPFMDALLNRLARGEVAIAEGAPGDPITVPDLVTSVRQGEREWNVEGGGLFRPRDVGVYYLVAGDDTVGAVSANLDPRESRLARASDAQVRHLWKGARIMALDQAGPAAFSASVRGDLRGTLLWLALALGLLEMVLASALRRRDT